MIPEDWYVISADELCQKITKGTTPTEGKVTSHGQIPFLRVNNLTVGGSWQIREPIIFVEEECHYSFLARSVCRPGDILINIVGPPLGKSTMLSNDYPSYNINQAIVVFRPKADVDANFLYFQINGERCQTWLERHSKKTSGQQNLTIESCKKLPIILPPLQEQRRIAKILFTWNLAIEATEQLIANSEAQKKALMQQLLTGKKRLPGFHGEWTKTTLGDLGKTYAGLSGKTKADFGSGKPFVPYKNVFANAELNMSELEYVRLSDGEKQNMVKTGDIIFTTSSETPEEVGMSSAVLTDIDELYLNSFCFGFRIEKQNEFLPIFAKHLFRSSELRRAISSLAQGSTRYNLSKNEFLKIVIHLPKRAEQEQIVEVLDAFETTPDAEQKKLKKLKVEKSALMQQLLTGKRRVAMNKEEAA